MVNFVNYIAKVTMDVFVSNFRKLAVSTEKPTALYIYGIRTSYQVYKSANNPLLYTIYDHLNKLYYSFENNGKSKNVDEDLRECIRTFIK